MSIQRSVIASMSQFDEFTVTDAAGKQQSMYVANLDRNPMLTSLSMPPAFAELKFDARFESGEFIKALPASTESELGISVTTESKMITFSWALRAENGFSYEIITEGQKRQ